MQSATPTATTTNSKKRIKIEGNATTIDSAVEFNALCSELSFLDIDEAYIMQQKEFFACLAYFYQQFERSYFISSG